jgi:tRNA(fMet)-specific endonuclease VapC
MILDTSVLIDIDRGIREEKIKRMKSGRTPKISSITRAEFFTGVHKRSETDKEKAVKLLGSVREIPLEGDIAEKAGEVLARKQRESLSIGLNDICMAATALVEGEKVLTKDTSDFQEIEELEVLAWEDF